MTMKLLLIFPVFISSFIGANSSEIIFPAPGDSFEIKRWTKEDFIKELGINDSAKALIHLFFYKNRKGKNQIIFGGAFLTGGVAATASPFEHGNDAKNFGEFVRPVAEPGATVLGALFVTSGIVKLRKYTFQKLYFHLVNYKNGVIIPEKYKRKLKKKYFPVHHTITPRF